MKTEQERLQEVRDRAKRMSRKVKNSIRSKGNRITGNVVSREVI